MTLTAQQMDRAIDEHFGYEAADDIDGVISTLAPDVVHDIVGWPAGPRSVPKMPAPSTSGSSPTSPTGRFNA